MALFARVAKLGSRAYGARHARARPSVMQCVLAVRETETVVIKQSRLNIVAQGLSNSLVRSLPTHLSLKKREVAQHLHLTHTFRQA